MTKYVYTVEFNFIENNHSTFEIFASFTHVHNILISPAFQEQRNQIKLI